MSEQINRDEVLALAAQAGFGVSGGFIMPPHAGHITSQMEAFAQAVALSRRPAAAAEAGNLYLCKVTHSVTGESQQCVLLKVDEDDCDWRTADDHSELSNAFDVDGFQIVSVIGPAAAEVAAEPELLPQEKTILSEMSRFYPVDGPIAESRAMMCWNMVAAHLSAAGQGKDSERLDFMEREGLFIRCNWKNTGFCGPTGQEWEANALYTIPTVYGRTVREAIDAAMKAGAQGDKA